MKKINFISIVLAVSLFGFIGCAGVFDSPAKTNQTDTADVADTSDETGGTTSTGTGSDDATDPMDGVDTSTDHRVLYIPVIGVSNSNESASMRSARIAVDAGVYTPGNDDPNNILSGIYYRFPVVVGVTQDSSHYVGDSFDYVDKFGVTIHTTIGTNAAGDIIYVGTFEDNVSYYKFTIHTDDTVDLHQVIDYRYIDANKPNITYNAIIETSSVSARIVNGTTIKGTFVEKRIRVYDIEPNNAYLAKYTYEMRTDASTYISQIVDLSNLTIPTSDFTHTKVYDMLINESVYDTSMVEGNAGVETSRYSDGNLYGVWFYNGVWQWIITENGYDSVDIVDNNGVSFSTTAADALDWVWANVQ